MPSPAELLDMSGRTIVVAGAGGGGIGTAISGMLAAAGALVVGVDVSAEALDDFSAATTGVDNRPHPAVVADVRSAQDVERAVATAGDEFYGLVHVAGGMLSSIAGLSSMPFGAPYAAAKAALMSLVRTAAIEWGSAGIRINAVAPGTVRTPRSLKNNPHPPPDTAAERAAVPLGRRGLADDIAGAVTFLLSDLAGWITGQVLAVDGGATARPPFIGEDNLPVFLHDDALRERLAGRQE